MKINYLNTALIALTLFSCGSINNKQIDYQTISPENSSEYTNKATEKAKQLLSENKFTPFETLQIQKLENTEKNSNVLLHTNNEPLQKSGNEIYNHLKERTMYVGTSYMCNKCPNMHLSNASGFVIHEDGVMVTNYHVIDGKEDFKISAVFATDHEGNVYPVSKILSASKSNDLAILQLDTQGKKLKSLELAEEELVGEDVYVMGHPFNLTFFMGKGIISRKYVKSSTTRISITADYGVGASGGPVVNNFGQIVGVVSSTRTHYSNGSKANGDVQMVTKEVIPVSMLNNYINKG